MLCHFLSYNPLESVPFFVSFLLVWQKRQTAKSVDERCKETQRNDLLSWPCENHASCSSSWKVSPLNDEWEERVGKHPPTWQAIRDIHTNFAMIIHNVCHDYVTSIQASPFISSSCRLFLPWISWWRSVCSSLCSLQTPDCWCPSDELCTCSSARWWSAPHTYSMRREEKSI